MYRGYWLLVTHDKYELPLAVAESAEELARMTGFHPASVRVGVNHWLKGDVKFPTFVRVDYEREDE